MAIASKVERKLDAERFDKLHNVIVWDGLRPDCVPRSSTEDAMIQEMVELLSDSPADSLHTYGLLQEVINGVVTQFQSSICSASCYRNAHHHCDCDRDCALTFHPN